MPTFGFRIGLSNVRINPSDRAVDAPLRVGSAMRICSGGRIPKRSPKGIDGFERATDWPVKRPTLWDKSATLATTFHCRISVENLRMAFLRQAITKSVSLEHWRGRPGMLAVLCKLNFSISLFVQINYNAINSAVKLLIRARNFEPTISSQAFGSGRPVRLELRLPFECARTNRIKSMQRSSARNGLHFFGILNSNF